MSKVKIIAFDLDGTAIIAHKELPLENRSALEKASENGVYIVPCTGRLLSFLPESIRSLKNLRYAITCNGASVEDIKNRTKLYTAFLTPKKIKEILDILDDFDIYKEVYSSGQAYTVIGNPEKAKSYFSFPDDKMHFTTKKYIFVDNLSEYFSEHGLSAEKINLPYLPIEIRQTVKDKLSKVEGLKLTSSIPDNLEINDAKATKGFALEALCKYLNISPDEAMAIGDNGNDVPMLKYAGISYAMGNSSDETFISAKFRTSSCEEFGLRDAVLKELDK